MNKLNPLERNNVTLAGNPQARRAMVFVHGFGTDQRAWKTVAESFREDFSLVLLDNVGAGQSEPAAFLQSRYLNLGGYVSDLFEVCDALLLQDAILVGHSVGAMICLLAAARRPGRFSRLVMIGASPRYLDDEGYRGGFAEADLKALYQEVSLRYSEWADAFAPAAGQCRQAAAGTPFCRDDEEHPGRSRPDRTVLDLPVRSPRRCLHAGHPDARDPVAG